LVEKILKSEVERQRTPSVQYLFFNAQRTIYEFKDGLSNIEKGSKISVKTTNHAFSITKTFTALATLQLAEQGKLNINEPVRKYLPEFLYSSEITIKQLLSHSAGIPNPMPLNWIHLASEHDAFNRDDFFRSIFTKYNKLKSGPNEKCSYSNLGYVILGQVIEQVSGMSYERYIQENMLKRIGLQSSEMSFLIPNSDENATGYHKTMSFSNFILGLLIDKSKYMGASVGEWKPFRNFYVNGPSYGGLIGTPRAFMKYIQELIKQDCTLLRSEYKTILFTENVIRSGKATGMCLSWFKGELNGKQYFAHAGGGGGYYCEIRIYPEARLGSVIMFNRSGMTDERFLDRVDAYFLDR